MASAPVEISLGSNRSRTMDLPWLRVSDIGFPPHAELPIHTHDRPVFAIALEGALDSRLPGRRLDCDRASVWTEPVGERHSNTVSRAGARVVALLPDPEAEELLGACAPLLDGVHHWRHGGVASLGRRMAFELRGEDAAARLALEGLALEALALGLRSGSGSASGSRPAWLRRGIDLLHDRFLERLDLLDIARQLDVEPQRLARTFRTAFGVSPGTYQRRLCLDWAARQLVEGDLPIGTVALRAGFCDQAHFTRQFRRHTGQTPGAWRRLRRTSARSSAARATGP